ncbi:MAG: flagellar protein FlgN [Steroidobacteraceae bacterium]
MTMDARLCHAHLDRLLTEEAAILQQLQTLLDKEHQLIVSNEIEALDSAGNEREAYIGALLKIDSERQTLCRASGRSPDKVGLADLLKWCDPSGALQRRWKTSTETILQCRTSNDRNGALVNSRLKRVEGMLDTLNGQNGRESKVYTARGNAYQQANAGRVFNVQA